MAFVSNKVQDDYELKKQQIRVAAENDLLTFIKLIAPHRVIGSIHEELCTWWEREGALSHQLTLLPRDHGKSAFVAYRVAWWITKCPDIRILYISSTSNLAEKQLKFIKDILTSDIYRFYWPDMVNPDESKREKWTNSEISIDHPLRKEEGVRDSTVFTGGLTTSLTGMHCDITVLDDVVVMENAYTKEGRDKVKQQYSLLSSIEGAEAKQWVVGTRYHPKDLYSELISMKADVYDEIGNIVDEKPIYEVFERQVENRGDGTGEFLWPRQQRYDGKWFGFDRDILSKKKAQYLDQTQFRAQYYNNPNDPEGAGIKRSYFQYYDKKFINKVNGKFCYNGKPLNIFAAADFAYSTNKKADWTVIIVVGIDSDNNYYVLDIDRFRASSIKEQFDHIVSLVLKWGFRKLRTEATSAQVTVLKELKEVYIKQKGLALTVDDFSPNQRKGSKEEKIDLTLRPRYENRSIWHYQGGNCQILEDELVVSNPPFDDTKDALSQCIEMCVPPMSNSNNYGTRLNETGLNKVFNSRFGGISHY